MPLASKNPPAPEVFRDLQPGSPWLIEGSESDGLCHLYFDDAQHSWVRPSIRELILSGPRAELLPILRTLRYLWTLRP